MYPFRSWIMCICTIWLAECPKRESAYKQHLSIVEVNLFKNMYEGKENIKFTFFFLAECINCLIYGLTVFQFQSTHLSGRGLCTKCELFGHVERSDKAFCSLTRYNAGWISWRWFCPQSHCFVVHQWKVNCLRVILCEVSLKQVHASPCMVCSLTQSVKQFAVPRTRQQFIVTARIFLRWYK